MCPNRVEELESRVKELQASVEGLTDELVECKVRLRELEDAVDEEMGFVPKTQRSDDWQPDGDTTDADASESQDAAEAPNTEGPEKEDNTEESESDIIVA